MNEIIQWFKIFNQNSLLYLLMKLTRLIVGNFCWSLSNKRKKGLFKPNNYLQFLYLTRVRVRGCKCLTLLSIIKPKLQLVHHEGTVVSLQVVFFFYRGEIASPGFDFRVFPSGLVVLPRQKNLMAGERRYGFMPFKRRLTQIETRTVSSKIWTRINKFIFYDSNCYVTSVYRFNVKKKFWYQ